MKFKVGDFIENKWNNSILLVTKVGYSITYTRDEYDQTTCIFNTDLPLFTKLFGLPIND